MAQEIERKFLVAGASWKDGAIGMLIRQGYLSSVKERTVRVRVAGGKAFLTIKGVNRGVTRTEGRATSSRYARAAVPGPVYRIGIMCAS